MRPAPVRQSLIRQDPLWRALGLLGIRWQRVTAAVGLGVGALGSALALAAVSAWLIARASQMPPVMHLSVAVVGVRAFGISRGVFRYLERLASHDVALRGMAELRTRIYANLAAGPTAAVAPLRRGDLLARVGHDVDDVGDVVVRSIIPAGVAAILSLGAVVLVGAFLPGAALVLALCLLAAGVVSPWLTARATRDAEERSAAARTRMSETSLRILEDAPQLVVAGLLPEHLDQLRAADAELTRTTDDGARPLALASAIEPLAIGVAVLASLLLGIPALTAGHLAAVELAVVVLTPLAAFEATSTLPAAANQLLRSRQAAIRIMALLDAAAPPAAGVTREAPAVSAPSALSAPGTLSVPGTRSALSAHGVTCGWPGHDAVLADLDLDLAPGQIVALVGPSGIGKTTALLTLAGLVPPLTGHISAPTHGVVLTTEDAHLFHTTVLENLRVARGDVTETEASQALETVGLSAWLTGLPAGLDTILGPDGSTVSGGERRRLLLARALLTTAQVLLVDEPTEHLDPSSADQLFTEILPRLAAQGRAVLVATHRLSGLTHADEVLLLAPPTACGPARVSHRATHTELLRTNSQYRGAWLVEQTAQHDLAPGADLVDRAKFRA